MVRHSARRYGTLRGAGRRAGGAVSKAASPELGHLAAPGATIGIGAARLRCRCSRGVNKLHRPSTILSHQNPLAETRLGAFEDLRPAEEAARPCFNTLPLCQEGNNYEADIVHVVPGWGLCAFCRWPKPSLA